MKWASMIVLWMAVVHSGLSYADIDMNVGECASADDTSSFLRSQKQKPVAMMNRITTRLDIAPALLDETTFDNITAPRWVWLQKYEGMLKHWDAVTRRYNYNGIQATRGRKVFEELRDVQLKLGNIREVDTGLAIQMLTSTPDFSRWFLLQGNKPMGKDPSQYCVLFEGTKLGLFNYQELSTGGLLASEYKVIEAEDKCLDIAPVDIVNCEARHDTEKAWGSQRYYIAVDSEAHSGEDKRKYLGSLIVSFAVEPKTGKYEAVATVSSGATFPLFSGQGFRFFPPVIKSFK